MHVYCERGEEIDIFYVRLPRFERLVQVRGRPARGDVVAQNFRELVRRLFRDVVAPGAEGRQKIPRFVERHIAVHHAADADRAQLFERNAVLLLYVRRELGIAVLQPFADILEGVRPDSALEPVLPIVRAARDGHVLLVREHRLDARGAELDAERRPALFDALFPIVCHNLLPPLRPRRRPTDGDAQPGAVFRFFYCNRLWEK